MLKKGGQLLLTAPFNIQQETTVRAVVNGEGVVEHLLEPCYHGDPLSDHGVLAYYDFGMALKDDLHQAGFRNVRVACYRSDAWGYPAGGVAFIARQGSAKAKPTHLYRVGSQQKVTGIDQAGYHFE